jgi:hypothetical protein
METDFVHYNADVDQQTKNEIRNVNDYWMNRKLVILIILLLLESIIRTHPLTIAIVLLHHLIHLEI